MKYEFFVDSDPKPQSRPRFTTYGGRYHAYESEEITAWKQTVYAKANEVFQKQGRIMLQGALEARIIVYRNIPDSWTGKKRSMAESGILYPIQRPDVDNYIKAVLDGIGLKNFPKIMFNDDSQIVSIYAIKKFASTNFPHGVYVSLTEWDDYRKECRG